jgi:hypothetical protein
MNFKIDPCQSTMKYVESKGKYPIQNYDINKISDTCYGICRAFDSYNSDVTEKCENQCSDLVNEIKHKNGFSTCYMKRPQKFDGFLQTERLFPQILAKTQDPRRSYELCCSQCTNSNYPNSCREMCALDASSIMSSSNTQENYSRNCGNVSKRSVVYSVGCIIILICILYLLCLFLMNMINKHVKSKH